MDFPEPLRQQLEQHGQLQLIAFWDQLSEIEQQSLVRQLDDIDFTDVSELIDKALHPAPAAAIDQTIAPLKNAIRLPETSVDRDRWQTADARGRELLDQGKVGVILVAGGQGSRLGFPHPKGMFPIGPVTERTLFQIFFEQLLALSNRHGVRIPYFIMTSDATHEETEQFLQQHAWFGYPTEDVFLFRQGKLPAVDDQQGKILLSSPSEIAMSPDGHGGLLRALQKAKLIEQMQIRGIEYLYYHQVDNPCARLCDPVMLGFHDQLQAEVSTKVVAKRDASEKVGILAEADGKQAIIEYSDLPETLAQQTDDQGELAYWAGNIAIHVFSRSLLERLTSAGQGLPIHIAHKKVPFLEASGAAVDPTEPNAFKFERFIFDSIPLAQQPLVLETSRAEEFNPVKNAEGNDSPATSRAAVSALGRSWLEQAGYQVAVDAAVEISPLIALEPADLRDQLQPDQLEGPEIILTPTHDAPSNIP